MAYVDGFLLPVPKKNLAAYKKMARLGAEVWLKHGALEFRECVGDDLAVKGLMGFPEVVKPKAGETIMFSWIVFKSRAHRDAVNQKVMQDPAITGTDAKAMPFDCTRMAYGGFKVMVDAAGKSKAKARKA